MAATIKDVAARAGVSHITVSNVIHGNMARVSVQTAERVREAIAALNYVPNPGARYLRKTRVGILALALPSLRHPLFSEISEAIVAAAAARDYIVLIDHTGGDRTHEARVANGLRPLTIDGVILGAVALRSEDLGAQPQGPPVVLLGHQPPGTQFDRVNSDDYTGARLATEHLISCGRRRIGAIRFWRDETDVVSALRHNGYRDALNAAGLEVKPNRIVTAPPECYHRRDGAYAMQQLLQRDPSIDAVFCFNDPMALGAMKTLHAADRRVPEDVAVVGYDDIEDGHYTTPSLTTVSVSAHETGRRAVSLLLDRIEGTSSTFPRHESVPVSVIARQSTTGSQAPDLLLEA